MLIYIQFTFNQVEEEFPQYLKEKQLTLIHKGNVVEGCTYPQPGMALRHKSGVTMRIMNRFTNYENYSTDYALAAVNIKREHLKLFEQ
jgi:hypothetical protein